MLLSYFKERWVLYLALTLFVFFKIPDLYCAFYWDESWVYAPAISMMYAHGPSLLPDVIPLEYSRGHPLLFVATCAEWMRVFGKSHLSMHCFSLFISLLLAVALYEISLKIFNPRVAQLSIALLLPGLAFYTESSFMLNDIMITLFILLSLYFYIRNKYFLTAVSLTLLFYTKESGMVAAVAIAFDLAIRIFYRTISLKDSLFKILSLSIPMILIALFFAQQKHIYGWYLNPQHTGIVNTGILNTFSNLQRTLDCIFYNEKKIYFFWMLIALSLVAAWKQRKPKYLLLILSAFIIYLCTNVFSNKDVIFYVLMAYLLFILIRFLIQPFVLYNKVQERFIKLIIIFSLCFTYFSCINFYENRYVFPLVGLISVLLLSVYYDFFISQSVKSSYIYILLAAILIGLNNFRSRAQGDELADYDRMKVQQALVDYLETKDLYDANIYTTSYLEQVHLQDPKTGFLHSEKFFKNVTNELSLQTKIIAVDNIDSDVSQYKKICTDTSFVLVYRYVKGYDWGEVYRRKQ